MRALDGATIGLLKKYGSDIVPDSMLRYAKGVCGSSNVLSVPRASTDKPLYAVICPRYLNNRDTVVLYDSGLQRIEEEKTDLFLADFGTFVKGQLNKEARRKYRTQGWFWITASLVLFCTGTAFIAWRFKLDALSLFTPGDVLPLCLLLLGIYMTPVVMSWRNSQEMLQTSAEYETIELLRQRQLPRS